MVNIDNDGNKTKKGQIELRDTEIVFQSADSEPVIWDLRYLRRYGYDSNLFSFESGRRSATGHGIFAFHCRQAELLFNMLQERIQHLGEEDQRLLMGAGRVRGSQSLNDHRPGSGLSTHSDEPVSPLHVSPALNNGHYINREAVQNHENQLHLAASEPVAHSNGNNRARTTVGGLSNNHTFNIANNSQHYAIPKWHYGAPALDNYVNVPAGGRQTEVVYLNDPYVAAASPAGEEPTLNYVQVDVQQSNGVMQAGGGGDGPGVSTPRVSKPQTLDDVTQTDAASGYTSIDFKRTEALNNSRSAVATDNGPRKTRHDSNIDDRAWPDCRSTVKS